MRPRRKAAPIRPLPRKPFKLLSIARHTSLLPPLPPVPRLRLGRFSAFGIRDFLDDKIYNEAASESALLWVKRSNPNNVIPPRLPIRTTPPYIPVFVPHLPLPAWGVQMRLPAFIIRRVRQKTLQLVRVMEGPYGLYGSDQSSPDDVDV